MEQEHGEQESHRAVELDRGPAYPPWLLEEQTGKEIEDQGRKRQPAIDIQTLMDARARDFPKGWCLGTAPIG